MRSDAAAPIGFRQVIDLFSIGFESDARWLIAIRSPGGPTESSGWMHTLTRDQFRFLATETLGQRLNFFRIRFRLGDAVRGLRASCNANFAFERRMSYF